MRKRIRSLGDLKVRTIKIIGRTNPPTVIEIPNHQGFTKTSSMTDYVKKHLVRRSFVDPSHVDIGVKAGGKKFYSASHCDHLVVDATAFTPPRQWQRASTDRPYQLLSDFHFGILPGAFSSFLSAINADAVAAAAKEAFNGFTDQFPMEVSLPNFLLELNPFEGLGKLKFYRKKAQEELIALRGSNLAGAVSGNYLGLEFGVKPFLDDLEKLRNIVATVDRGLQVLRESKGKSSKLNFRRNLSPNLAVGMPAVVSGGGRQFNLVPTQYCTLTSLSSEFRAGAWLYHDLDLDSASARVRAYAAALGLLNPLAVIWEAVPFSFVLDWVTDVSGILTELKAQPFLGDWRVRDMTYSVKDIAIFKSEVSLNEDLPTRWFPTGNIQVRRYQRRIGLPYKSVGFSFPLTGKQSLLSAALATGMIPDLDRIGRRV